MTPVVSILIATHNREDDLRRTLEAFRALAPDSPTFEVVVIDNNSSDATPDVVREFADLPARYLFEERPGKNCALNRALREVPLGEIVVFSDDDINPDANWIKEIVAVSARRPEHDVFGGKVEVVYPHNDVPGWARSPRLARWAFAEHDLGPDVVEYPPDRFPAGPNFWVRRSVLDSGRRYDESVGPRPKDRIMGSETSFLIRLRDDGHPPCFAPSARVGHRIQPRLLTAAGIRQKARWNGRWMPRLRGIEPAELFRAAPGRWRLYRLLALGRQYVRYGLAMLTPSADARVTRSIEALRGIAFNQESLRLSRQDPSTWQVGMIPRTTDAQLSAEAAERE